MKEQLTAAAAHWGRAETILVDAIRERNNPNLRAIIFRQQFTHMTTHRLYVPLGARFVG